MATQTPTSLQNHSIFFPCPPFNLSLAPLDARHPVHCSRRLYLFHCTPPFQSHETQLSLLTTALRALLKRCPYLGGQAIRGRAPPSSTMSSQTPIGNEHDQWTDIVSSGPGLELVVRDLKGEMSSFAELEKRDFEPELLPYDLLVPVPPDYGARDEDEVCAACKVQFSAIEGGTILSWAMSHSVADGAGNDEIIRMLGEEMRRAEQGMKNGAGERKDSGNGSLAMTEVGMDRTFLRNITSSVKFNIADHPAFIDSTSPPSSNPTSPNLKPAKSTTPDISKPTKPLLLTISSTSLASLKTDLTFSPTSKFYAPISTHDALSALLWRTQVRLHLLHYPLPPSTPLSALTSTLFLPSSTRRHLHLPDTYIGNCVYQLCASLDLETLLSEDGLRHAAATLRTAILRVKEMATGNGGELESYFVELKSRWLEWRFMRDMDLTGKGDAGKWGVGMGTDWTGGSVICSDEGSWGEEWGSIVRFRYPGEVFNCILPRLADGTAEVMIVVSEREEEWVRGVEGFGKYLG